MKINIYLMLVLLGCLVVSCTEDYETPKDEDPIVNPPTTPAGEILIDNELLRDDSYLLVEDAMNNTVFLMDRAANKRFEWSLSSGLGNDVQLLPDGQLLAMLETENPQIQFGGFGGKIQRIRPNNTIHWEFNYASDNYIAHHDLELLPNGNVLFLAWERKTAEEAIEAGYESAIDLMPETLIEIDRDTKEIVWEWHAWDHLIQDIDPEQENYGVISDHPERIHINHHPSPNGNIMHSNGITYDPENDIIYMSVNLFSEVWVIDHSTTAQEAASSSGGNYDKGGDLIYRFGNPQAYQNNEGERLFFNNHHPNIAQLPARNMLIFVNGNNINQSSVYQLQLPETFALLPNTNNEPEIVWSFTHPDLYSQKVSSAVRLSNGNTLITEGDFGIWEVTTSGEVVWKFKADGVFWRTYAFDKDSDAILSLALQ